MAVVAKLYGNFLMKALNKEIDWDTDVIKVMLCSAFTANQDGNIYLANVTKTEVIGTGYTAGGKALTFTGATAIAYDSATNIIKLDADDVVWTNSTITASYAIIYDDTPATNKPLVGYVDFGGSNVSTAGDFKIQWDALGIASITIA